MNTISSATSIWPAATGNTSASPTAPGSSGGNTSSNTLDADSFITLLTTQLQAQDPLNPLDPNQMVDELTSMNTLQQIIQMREDLDAMLGAAQGASGSPASAQKNTSSAGKNSVTNPGDSQTAKFAAATALLNSMNL